jgi:hypothetical protein
LQRLADRALAPAYLNYLRRTPAKSLVTVHNLAFQGLFDHAALFELGLPDAAWSMHGVEYHGYLSFLKAGLQHADAISTVSPSYAREIQTDAEGMGMAGLLRIARPTSPASSTASTRATGTRRTTTTCPNATARADSRTRAQQGSAAGRGGPRSACRPAAAGRGEPPHRTEGARPVS